MVPAIVPEYLGLAGLYCCHFGACDALLALHRKPHQPSPQHNRGRSVHSHTLRHACGYMLAGKGHEFFAKLAQLRHDEPLAYGLLKLLSDRGYQSQRPKKGKCCAINRANCMSENFRIAQLVSILRTRCTGLFGWSCRSILRTRRTGLFGWSFLRAL